MYTLEYSFPSLPAALTQVLPQPLELYPESDDVVKKQPVAGTIEATARENDNPFFAALNPGPPPLNFKADLSNVVLPAPLIPATVFSFPFTSKQLK